MPRSGLFPLILLLAGCAAPPPAAGPEMRPLGDRVAKLEQDIQAMRAEQKAMMPALQRLVQFEGDIKQLVDNLAVLSGEGGATPPPPPAALPSGAGQPPAPAPAATAPRPATATPALPPARPAEEARPPVTGDAFGIHIASYRGQTAASAGWVLLRRKHGDVLGGLDSQLQELDMRDGRGAFLRLKAGPFATRAAADAACLTLRGRGEFCQVTDFAGSPPASSAGPATPVS